MNIHLHKYDILKLICDKYQISYDILKNDIGTTVDIVLKESGTVITWEGTGYETEIKKE